jgi:hypothetical protein
VGLPRPCAGVERAFGFGFIALLAQPRQPLLLQLATVSINQEDIRLAEFVAFHLIVVDADDNFSPRSTAR